MNAVCGWDDNDCCAQSYSGSIPVGGISSFTLAEKVNIWNVSTQKPIAFSPLVYPDLTKQALTRNVGTTNRVVAGVLVRQTRLNKGECGQGTLMDDKFAFFEGSWRHRNILDSCVLDKNNTEDAYGVDPVFLRTSTLFSIDDFLMMGNYYNTSDPAEVNQAANSPWGFRYNKFGNKEFEKEGFFAFMDINFNQQRATNFAKYLEDGFFIDEQTESVEVNFIIYNGIYGHFTVCELYFTWDFGGTINIESNFKNFNGSPYQTKADMGRFVMEMVFLSLILMQAAFEMKEVISSIIAGEFADYLSDFWNWIDWLGIGMFVGVFSVWFFDYVPLVMAFTPEIRYNVYNDYTSTANWVNNINRDEYNLLVEQYGKASQILQTLDTYMELNGFCILLVLVRVLKLLDFQPRLGLVTKTIFNAMTDLIHFGFVFILILGLYWIMSFYLFGSSKDDFHTLRKAWNANWDMMLGGTDAYDELTESIVGFCFAYSMNIIVFFILLNILLAIIVEAYMDLRESQKDTPSMTQALLPPMPYLPASAWSW